VQDVPDEMSEEERHAWERPGAFLEAPGVWRLPLPLPGDSLKAVNVYAVEDGDRLVLIDGGWAMEAASTQLRTALAQIGRSVGDIREFLVTHIHRDHYTLALEVRRETGSRVSLGAGERTTLQALLGEIEQPAEDLFWAAGAFELSRAAAEIRANSAGERSRYEHPDRWLPDGLDLPLQDRQLRVIATPGHTRGHVVFQDVAAGVLFAGDHVLPHITPSIGVELTRPPSPLRDFLNSLRIVRALPDAQLFPAHGPVRPSVHGRIGELVRHHEQRLVVMRDAVASGASTAFDVARAITWTRRRRLLADMDLFNRMLAVQETDAHLVVLVEDGQLTRTTRDGVNHYEVLRNS
jgi:glyoxylase-like metal-dependent hydrolase (beta-lactamase superfamily II)